MGFRVLGFGLNRKCQLVTVVMHSACAVALLLCLNLELHRNTGCRCNDSDSRQLLTVIVTSALQEIMSNPNALGIMSGLRMTMSSQDELN